MLHPCAQVFEAAASAHPPVARETSPRSPRSTVTVRPRAQLLFIYTGEHRKHSPGIALPAGHTN
jgi:hypothetical protein